MDTGTSSSPVFLRRQYRLRHLHSICGRNLRVPDTMSSEPQYTGFYFTLHAMQSAPAFYTSETIRNSPHPNWKNFSSLVFAETTNLSTQSIVIRIWASCNSKCLLVIEWFVHFLGLVLIGERIPNTGHYFDINTIIFQLHNGYYSCSSSINRPSTQASGLPQIVLEDGKSIDKQSYSYASLRRIHTGQQALWQTRSNISNIQLQINERLKSHEALRIKKKEMRNVTLHLELLKLEQTKLEDIVAASKLLCDDLAENNSQRGGCILDSWQSLKKEKEHWTERHKALLEKKDSLIRTSSFLTMRRRQLISELSAIYPIQQVSDREYRICGVLLPNSEEFAGHNDISIAVALGYVGHLVLMISQFLNVPVRYPLIHYGSQSRVVDHIKLDIAYGDREFPLYLRGKNKYQFRYGVFLLNKNIAQLRAYCGLKIEDLRVTLKNVADLLEKKFTNNDVLPIEAISHMSISTFIPNIQGNNIRGVTSADQMLPRSENDSPNPAGGNGSLAGRNLSHFTVGSGSSIDTDTGLENTNHKRLERREIDSRFRLSGSLDHGLDRIQRTHSFTSQTSQKSRPLGYHQRIASCKLSTESLVHSAAVPSALCHDSPTPVNKPEGVNNGITLPICDSSEQNHSKYNVLTQADMLPQR